MPDDQAMQKEEQPGYRKLYSEIVKHDNTERIDRTVVVVLHQ